MISSFKHIKDALLYKSRGIITLEEVQLAIRTKELTILIDTKVEDSGEYLRVRLMVRI